jgi:hypothetical protein
MNEQNSVSVIMIVVTITSVAYVSNAMTGDQVDNFLRANGYTSYSQFKKSINTGNFTEDFGKKLKSEQTADYVSVANIADLYNRTELVIRGTVESSSLDVKLDPQGVDMPDIHTKFNLQISDVIKGDYNGITVVVYQKGGTFKGIVFSVRDEPLMKVGDEVVLYLNKYLDGYTIYAGPKGRFQIIDGKLFNIAELIPRIQAVENNLFMNGISVDQLKNMIP